MPFPQRPVSGLLAAAALLAFSAAIPVAAQTTNLIFADGFESGDLSSWSAVREQRPGSLQVNPAAALDGTGNGLEVRGGSRAWLLSRHDQPESGVRVFFFFDPDNWEMVLKARAEILRFYARGNRHHLSLVLRRAGEGLFRLGLVVRGNRGRYEPIGSGLVMSGEANFVEIEWQAASSPAGSDGSAALWINGELEANEPSIANGQLDVRAIQVGLVGGNVGATRGSFYFDEFESFRTLAP